MVKPNKQRGQKAPFLKVKDLPETQSPDDLPPAFSFEKMQDKSGSSVNCCQDDDLSYLAKRFFMLSRMPWKQIRSAPRTGLGSEEIIRSSIKRPIPRSVTEDVEHFLALHYVGNKRFLGYRVGQIFYVLWIDHDFSVYNHG